MSTPLENAIALCRRGFAVIPIAHMTKKPEIPGWQTMSLAEADLPTYFNGGPTNIGGLNGEPSGWHVDIDIDHPRAVELADQYLPPTNAIFGRASKLRSHWIYRVSAPIKTKKFQSKTAGMIVELRSTGTQTVLPGSTHPSGELIEWENPEGEPATVEPTVLLAAVKSLAEATRTSLGERVVPTATAATAPTTAPAAMPTAVAGSASATTRYGTQAIAGEIAELAAIQKGGRNDALNKAAFRLGQLVGGGEIMEQDAIDALMNAAVPWLGDDFTDEETCRTISSGLTAGKAEPRRPEPRDAEASQGSADDNILGKIDPASGKLILSTSRTLPTAEAYIGQYHRHEDGSAMLLNYAGAFFAWRHNRYAEIEPGEIEQQLFPWLHAALEVKEKDGKFELIPFRASPRSVDAALQTVSAHTYLSASITPPAWLCAAAGRPAATALLPTPSGNLNLFTRELLPATPLLFATNGIDFEYQPDARTPTRWLAFLNQLWEHDQEQINTLQEWFAYCLTGQTEQEKMLLVIGPKRSGKGTIARVLTRLIGQGSVAAPTVSALAGPFGLQPLIGKTLAIVSDARFTGQNIGTVVERLLCISGEDTLNVPRKFLTDVTMKLSTRFMFLSNELPKLNDASGALAGRFILLRLTESYYGHEDHTLTPALWEELPAILNWALDGLQRLQARGHFVQPATLSEVIRELEDLSSAIGAFIRDWCDIGAAYTVDCVQLFAAWLNWCASQGRDHPGTRQTFGRDLRAAIPAISTSQSRDGEDRFRVYQGIRLKDVAAQRITANTAGMNNTLSHYASR